MDTKDLRSVTVRPCFIYTQRRPAPGPAQLRRPRLAFGEVAQGTRIPFRIDTLRWPR